MNYKTTIKGNTKHSSVALTPSSRHELIQIQSINGEQLIDARELHQQLEVKSIFSNWITRRIEEYKFKEGTDYFPKLEIIKGSKKPLNQYQLTIDMAKELAMIERNDKGRHIRQYFIACERKLRQQVAALPTINQSLKGIKAIKLNGYTLYPLTEVRTAIGMSKQMNQYTRHKYQQHFVLFDNKIYCTEDYAHHIAHQRAVSINRKVLQMQQPVLPTGFGMGLLPFPSDKGGVL